MLALTTSILAPDRCLELYNPSLTLGSIKSTFIPLIFPRIYIVDLTLHDTILPTHLPLTTDPRSISGLSNSSRLRRFQRHNTSLLILI